MSNGYQGPTGGGSLLTGFLKGMAQGKIRKKNEAMMLDELDLKKRTLKNQEDALKLKQEADARKQAAGDKFFQMLMGLDTLKPAPQPAYGMSPQEQSAQMSFEQPQGLTDQIASQQVRGQLGQFDPMRLAAIQGIGKQAGYDVDLLGAGRLSQQQAKFGRGERVRGVNPTTGQPEFAYVKPGGETEWTGVRPEDTRAVTNINMGQKALMEGAVKQLPKNREAAMLAKSAVDRIDNALGLIEKQGDNITGWSGAIKRSLAPAAKLVGLDIEAMTDAQILDNLLATGQGSLRMEVIGPGPVSDYEGRVLREVAGRKMAAADGIKRILEYQRGSQERTIDTWNQDIENISGVGGYELVKNIYKPIKYKKRDKETPPPPPGFTVIE